MKVNITQAAKLCGRDRRTIQRAIKAGKLSLDQDHCVETDDLVACGLCAAEAVTGPLTFEHRPSAYVQLEALVAQLQLQGNRLEALLRTLLTHYPPPPAQRPPQRKR